MILSSPIAIAPNLEADVRVGNDWITISYADLPGSNGRTRYRWTILIGSQEFSEDDLQSGCNGGSLQDGLASLLSFLSAAAESLDYCERRGVDPFTDYDNNATLFQPEVTRWASEHSGEISLLACEIEESENLIQE